MERERWRERDGEREREMGVSGGSKVRECGWMCERLTHGGCGV